MTLKKNFFYGLLKIFGKTWITNEQMQLKKVFDYVKDFETQKNTDTIFN